jgi:acyl-CoA synthetase (AMP-forming)/AMP-acid ligase II
MSSAEPVRAPTVDAFLRAFAVSKFPPTAFCPSYGLAEHSVGLTTFGKIRVIVDRYQLEHNRSFVPVQRGASNSVELIGCGVPNLSISIRIVDPHTCRIMPANGVGEIWVDSLSKAAGYWGMPDLTKEIFDAKIVDEPGQNSWLRTGDLGILWNGEIFVTGRIKELVIIRGRNLYPYDIEDSVRYCHPMIRPGGVAAFSATRNDEEILVLMVEARSNKVQPMELDQMINTLRATVRQDHAVSCGAVWVVTPGFIPKTTSAKVMRSRCRELLNDAARNQQSNPDVKMSSIETIFLEFYADHSTSKPIVFSTIDPRIDDIDPSFEAIIVEAARLFIRLSQSTGGGLRVFHPVATVLSGVMETCHPSSLPASHIHSFFYARSLLPCPSSPCKWGSGR